MGTLNKSSERNHSVPCCSTASQWPSYTWCSLLYSLTHPPSYYLQLPQDITLSYAWPTNSFLNSVLAFSRLVYRVLASIVVFSLIRISFLCFPTFPTAFKYFTLCLYRQWSLPRLISGYYADVKKNMFILVFMFHACTCVSLFVQQTNWDYVVTVVPIVFCNKFPICFPFNSWFSHGTTCYSPPVLPCVPCLGCVEVKVSILSTIIKFEFL